MTEKVKNEKVKNNSHPEVISDLLFFKRMIYIFIVAILFTMTGAAQGYPELQVYPLAIFFGVFFQGMLSRMQDVPNKQPKDNVGMRVIAPFIMIPLFMILGKLVVAGFELFFQDLPILMEGLIVMTTIFFFYYMKRDDVKKMIKEINEAKAKKQKNEETETEND